MTFMSFLVLFIVAAVVAGILHYGLKFYIVAGHWSFISKLIVAYIGASYGSTWFGEWFDGVVASGVYLLPAIFGAAALTILVVDVVKTLRHS